MAGCKPRHTQRFCGRYGTSVRRDGVTIGVALHPTFWWVVTCSCCPFLEFEKIKDDAVSLAYRHYQADHPRDLVAFSINL